jgi:hypothetical protein
VNGDRANPTIYRANRWAMVALSALLMFGGSGMIWSITVDPVETDRASRVMASPVWDILAPAVGVVLILLGVICARLVFDPRMLIVDNDGIENRMGLRPRRAEWRDFQDIEGLRLVFGSKEGGKRRLIGLPAPFFGVDFRGMLNDIQSRIKRVRAEAKSPKPVDKL